MQFSSLEPEVMQKVVVERCWTTASYLMRCSWRQRRGRSQGLGNPPEGSLEVTGGQRGHWWSLEFTGVRGSLVVGAWARCSQVLGIFFQEFEKVYAPENYGFIKSEEEVQI